MLDDCAACWDDKAKEFAGVVRDRAHAPDGRNAGYAGQELDGWRAQVVHGVERLRDTQKRLVRARTGRHGCGNRHQRPRKFAVKQEGRCAVAERTGGAVHGCGQQVRGDEQHRTPRWKGSGQLRTLAVSLDQDRE